MAAHPPPSYDGAGLVNLIAEIESRSGGTPTESALDSSRSAMLRDADTFVVILFDGLGTHQLDHPAAHDLREACAASIDAPFPTTTTVSLATVATGLRPADHGVLGYLQWEPDAGSIINTIHMTTAWGESVDLDLDGYLPRPNLWDRLARHGVESVVVQPFNFASSALTRVLYQGARFEGYASPDDAVAVVRDIASHPNRIVFLYVPHVDVAAHIAGQDSDAYEQAMTLANTVWRELTIRLPDSVAMVGTADHGHIDIANDRKILLEDADLRGSRVFGDGRSLYVTGDPTHLLDVTDGTWIPAPDLEAYLGGAVRTAYRQRLPDGAILMQDGTAAFTPYMNDRLIGHHGGLSREEREIPLLVR